MNCPEWEREIASETGSPELAVHLRGCPHCSEFAHEIEENRLALQKLALPPEAFGAVRRRVLHEIQAGNRPSVWWRWPAVAAAAALALAIVYLATMPKPIAPKLAVIPVHAPAVARQVPPPVMKVAKRTIPRRIKTQNHVAKAGPLVVKMLTDDPDVIIIWLVDPKGDSL